MSADPPTSNFDPVPPLFPSVSHRTDVVVAVRAQLPREALRSLLEGLGFSVPATAATHSEAVSIGQALKPAVLLLECGEAGTDCLETVRDLSRQVPSTRVLLLTRAGVTPQLPESLLAGARGVVDDNVPPELLARAIRSVAAGQYWVGRDSVVEVLSHVRRLQHPAPATPRPADSLTPRERQVIRGIASGESNHLLADRLGLSEGTIKGYVTAIYDKLGVSNRAELAALAVSRGLTDDPPHGADRSHSS